MRRLGERFLRRVAIAVAVVFTLTVVVPARVDGPGGGLPLSWLWGWLALRPASAAAAAFAGVPVQMRGRFINTDHYVSAGETKAPGGSGRAPQRVENGLVPYAPFEPSVPEGAAGQGITGFDAGTSRRLPDAATARSDVFSNADGSLTRRIAGGPMNYRGPDGRWRPIDTRLVPGDDGRWHVAANSLKVSLSSATSSRLASMSLPTGESIDYGLEGARRALARLDGSTATYPGILPHTDLELVAAGTGIKETLILHSPDAPSSWVFPLRLKGLTPRLAADGSVELTDAAGKVVAWFPRGYLQDSSMDPRHGGAAESTDLTYELIRHRGATALKVTADAAWLKDPSRVYPVRVDPTATTGTTGDVFVDNNPSGPSHNGDNLPVGTWNGGTTKTRSFIHLDNFDNDGFVGRRITGAKLKLFLTWTYSCGNARAFHVHAATQRWTVADLTSGSYPGPGISAPIGSLTVTDPGAACTNSGGNRGVGKWVTVPLQVATFESWAKGGANLGLALTASESDNYAWKRFTSANYSSGQYRPVLELTYAANVAPQVTLRHPANNFVAATLTPTLSARAHDPDGWPGTGFKFQFNVYDETGQTVIASSGAISNSSWTVPAGKLHWGNRYLYTVQVSDNAAYSAVYPAYAFSTPVPQPHLTSRLTRNADKGFDPSIGNYTTSATDASVETVGPELELVRSYNSLDLRTRGALGRGWSTLLDTKATEVKDAGGALRTVVVTYPDGQEIAFGREADGTFAAPLGRFASFTGGTGGYTMTDKDATVYRFAQPATPGEFKITSITDANGRALTFTYGADGRVASVRSASGRSLHFTWTTPAGSHYPHVSAVTTDPVTPGDPATALTWSYGYDNDNLVKVCDPTSTTLCTHYSYTWISQFANAMQNVGPYSYWRLGEAGGAAMAASSVQANSGVDNGVYHNVALGQAPAFDGSTATSAGFDGATSYVQLPGKLLTDGPHQSISLWFKTTGSGVLAGTQSSPVTELPASYQPALYVGTDGRLYGEFWTGSVGPMSSASAVNDGTWHHAVLAAGPGSQSLYLDGVKIGTLDRPVAGTSVEMVHAFLGTGRWTGRPAVSGDYGYFNGSISDAAFFGGEISAQVVADLHDAGKWPRSALTRITRPSGGVTAEITYDPATGKVATVTDENGGVWTMRAPTIAGSSDVYAASVLGGKPADYWRLSDVPGDTDAVNEVAGGTAGYNQDVTLGVAGPFADAKAAGFNGTTSAVADTAPSLDTTKDFSISAWAKLTDGTRHQRVVSMVGNRVPGVWLGFNHSSNRWQATMYHSDTDSPASTRASTTSVPTLNAWTHLVCTYDAATRALTLYVDGVLQQTVTIGGTKWRATGPLYIGRSIWNGAEADFFSGAIAEVATFGSVLSPEQVAVQFAASKQAAPVAITKVADGVAPIVMPVATVGVTDPGGHEISYAYDVVNGYRIVAQTDALGNTTKYGYDVGGYSSLVYDPRGVLTEQISDVRGNTIQSITCQDQAAKKCSSVYYTYYPDATTKTLTPDPRNDVMLTMRDGRSASATDDTYLTAHTYDTRGNQIEVTEPLGRKTTTVYTDGTSGVPAGLPTRVTSPGGATETIEYLPSGDVARTTDALGKTTSYTYDGLGRVLTETVTTTSFPQGRTTGYTYDGLGRVLTQTDPAVTNRVTGAVHTSVTTTEYNADGFVVSQTVADTTGGDAPRTVTTAFNAYGQIASETDASGDTTRYEYDRYGHMVKELEPDGGEVVNTYDAEGNLLTSKVVGFIGDPSDPSPPVDLITASNAYDPAGRVASETDAMGHSTVYTYTDNGLVAKIVSTDGTDSFVVEENFYDAAGNVVKQVTDNGGTVTTYTFDAAGRQTASTLDPGGLNRTTTYTYSPDDEILTKTDTDGSGAVAGLVQYLYDAEGNLLSETEYTSRDASPVARWALSGTRDSSGNSHLTASGGVTWTTSPRPAATFDGTGSLSSAAPVIDTAAGFTVTAWAYPTDAARNRAVVSQEGASESGFYLKLDSNGGDRWSFVMYDRDDQTSPVNYATSTQTAPLNAWTHLAAVYDPAARQARLYVNGVLSATRNLNAGQVPWTSYGPMHIGKLKYHGYYTDPWAGSVSDVQAYQRVLTAAEIGRIHAGTAPAAGAGVIRTTHLRDSGGLEVAEVDPMGETTDYSYDEEERVTVTVGPAVDSETGGGAPVRARPVTTVGYDTFGDVVETRDANGNVTVVAYDASGEVVSTTLPAYTPPGSTTPITPVVRNEYDVSGNLITATDELGNVTRFGYDQLGRLVRQTAPNGGVSTFAYDLSDNLLRITDANGSVTSATFDHLGHKLTETQVVRQSGTNYTTSYGYDGHGRMVEARSPEGVTLRYTYSPDDEVLTYTDGAGLITRHSYDGAGNRIRTVLPDGTYTTTTYDLADRPTSTSDHNAAGERLTLESKRYDSAGRVVETTDSRGTKSTFAYDPTGLVVSARQPVSTTDAIMTSFGYDLMGNQTRFTDGRGNPFITTYNAWNLPESRIEPVTARHPGAADRTFTVAYNAAGDPLWQSQPGGVRIDNTYDNMGHLVRQAGSGAEAATADRVFGYDTAGRMTTLSGPGGTNQIGYDDRGLVLSITGPSGDSSFTYDGDGRMASRTDAAGITRYTYDTAGRLHTMSNPDKGVDAALTYNTASLVSRIVYQSTGNSRTFTYDALHRPTSDELRTPGGATVATIRYDWDANGNLLIKDTTGFAGSAANTYTYDLANRLTSWNGTDYVYDKSGNRVVNGQRTFRYDERNRLIDEGNGTTYAYTARGTLSQTVNGTVALDTLADAFNQVTRQYASATSYRDYTYDGLGRVMRDGFAYSGLGNDLAADGDATYTRGPSGEVLGVATSGGTLLAWTDLHTDLVGQFTATGTTLSGSATYDPLGAIVATSGMKGNLGYQSEWTDAFTGRVNMFSRWYNTNTGQFDTRDTANNSPVPDSINANRYQYGDGNPLTVTDPTGHWGWNPFKKIKRAVKKAWNRTTRYVKRTYHYVKKKAKRVYHHAKKKYKKAKKWVKKKVRKVARYVKKKWKKAKKWVKKKWNKAKRYIKKKWKKAKRWVAKKYHKIKRKVKHAYNRLKQAGKSIVSKAKRVVRKTVHVVKDAYKKTAKWVREHKAEIAGFVVGAVVGVGCGALIGWTGVGAVACGALAGAAGSLVTGYMKGHRGMDLVKDALIGGATGALTGGLFSVGGAAIGAGARSVIAGAGMRKAIGTAAGAARSEVTGIARGTVNGLRNGLRRSVDCHSFAPSTKVLMADGSAKPIKDVKVGDKVAATEPAIGITSAKTVTATHRNVDVDLTDLKVRDPTTGSVTTISTTQHHPFWNSGTGSWSDARDLVAGDRLRTAAGAETVVVGVENRFGAKEMRDLTVAGFHTYYVLAGTEPVLVHNCGGGLNAAGKPCTCGGVKAVVLGEGMDAIKTTARGVGAKWYQAWGKNFAPGAFDMDKSLARNARWLNSKIDDGYVFYDIGIDPTRSRRSPFYALEQQILKDRGIATIPLPRP